jgi:Arc/MetJ-type ribon-helix-helix transcriptional regulator
MGNTFIMLAILLWAGGGCMPEVRVTIDENLDSFLNKIVASGLYPSKAEFMRCGMVHLLKDLNLIQSLINTNKKPSS